MFHFSLWVFSSDCLKGIFVETFYCDQPEDEYYGHIVCCVTSTPRLLVFIFLFACVLINVIISDYYLSTFLLPSAVFCFPCFSSSHNLKTVINFLMILSLLYYLLLWKYIVCRIVNSFYTTIIMSKCKAKQTKCPGPRWF